MRQVRVHEQLSRILLQREYSFLLAFGRSRGENARCRETVYADNALIIRARAVVVVLSTELGLCLGTFLSLFACSLLFVGLIGRMET
jgi:hypothetical protein